MENCHKTNKQWLVTVTSHKIVTKQTNNRVNGDLAIKLSHTKQTILIEELRVSVNGDLAIKLSHTKQTIIIEELIHQLKAKSEKVQSRDSLDGIHDPGVFTSKITPFTNSGKVIYVEESSSDGTQV